MCLVGSFSLGVLISRQSPEAGDRPCGINSRTDHGEIKSLIRFQGLFPTNELDPDPSKSFDGWRKFTWISAIKCCHERTMTERQSGCGKTASTRTQDSNAFS